MDSPAPELSRRWYGEVTRYDWLILLIASAGWVFDQFESQLFIITRDPLLAELLGSQTDQAAAHFWGDVLLSVFLVGGTVGGILFGSLADRFGRKSMMSATILVYSIFSGLTYFATTLWHVAVLRFFVAMGVGGEWAVAAALIAEVFPAAARARASGIFHATSILGTWMAAVAGLAVGAQWRGAYLIGILPALLVLWVRSVVREPERWRLAGARGERMGRLGDLFGNRKWALRAVPGLCLAAVGLATFWGITVAGQDLMRELLLRRGVDLESARQSAKFAYGIVETAGGGLGLLSFGPLAERLGRRGAFALFQAVAIVVVPFTCYVPQTEWQMLCTLPIFGFFTLGIHAGFAIYFPELFPSRLRATGAAVCFNGGRMAAAPMLWLSGELKSRLGVHLAVTGLSLLFLVGIGLLFFLPETKGRPLPE
ncbi:MAG TPA: MFS transporter [Planctomycetaceae bacterium]|jgi:MFS family permease|nr:MFS transporter [Planctomycetaceae bacterium]